MWAALYSCGTLRESTSGCNERARVQECQLSGILADKSIHVHVVTVSDDSICDGQVRVRRAIYNSGWGQWRVPVNKNGGGLSVPIFMEARVMGRDWMICKWH